MAGKFKWFIIKQVWVNKFEKPQIYGLVVSAFYVSGDLEGCMRGSMKPGQFQRSKYFRYIPSHSCSYITLFYITYYGSRVT